jgi:pimeloyl-ACP methyl ester carboxylesterase
VKTTFAIITAVAALTACQDVQAPQAPPPPKAAVTSVQTDAAGTQIVIGETGPGSVYALYKPASWNGRLVLYAHGAVPPQIPVRLPPVPWRDALLARGYAFAHSSRSETGYALQDGLQRTRQLVGLFTAQFGPPQRTYVTGQSMGGLIALALAEKNPELFDGAIPMCSLPGGMKMQINYWWNTRVVFDYFFPGVLPGDALTVPEGLVFDPDLATAVSNALQANPPRAMELAAVDQIDIQYASFSELVAAIVDVMRTHVNFTNNALDHTHGHAFFDNATTVYTGSNDDAALNAGADRFSSPPDAQKYVEHYYQPDGRLTIPVLTLHNTRDDLAPFAHEAAYAQLVAANGASDLLVQRAITRFGHCNFTVSERVDAVEQLAAWVEAGVRPLP